MSTTYRWGVVRSLNPRTVWLEGDPIDLEQPASSNGVYGLKVNDRVWVALVDSPSSRRHDRSLVIVLKAGGVPFPEPVHVPYPDNWEYSIAASSVTGWVTIARFPGNGRASARFHVMNGDSGDHDLLTIRADVAYGQASIVLESYNPFGRSSPIITAARYLTDSADGTYGPGILQLYFQETAVDWWVTCESTPNKALSKVWEPLFSASTTGYSTTPREQVGIGVTSTLLLPLQNGHANYSGAPSWDEARYGMTPGSVVTLTGLVRIADATSQTIATLPPGYRPVGDIMFAVYAFTGSAVLGRVQVTDAGLVQVTTPAIGTSGAYISLSGITFPAFQ